MVYQKKKRERERNPKDQKIYEKGLYLINDTKMKQNHIQKTVRAHGAGDSERSHPGCGPAAADAAWCDDSGTQLGIAACS